MSRFGQYTVTLLRLMLFIVLTIVSIIPVRSWVSAQDSSTPVRIVRSFPTIEYGVDNPKGLAFSSTANTFLILDGSANVTLVTMGEDYAGTRVMPEAQNDPMNTAFDAQTGSLFMFNRGTSELAKITVDGKGLPDTSAAPTRFAWEAYGVKDPQGLAFDEEHGRLFILDAGKAQILSVSPHPTLGFDAEEAIRSNKVQHISLKKLGSASFKGLAYNP